MKKKKIFTPIIAVGLAISLSVGSEVDTRDLRPDVIIDLHYTQIDNLVFGSIPNTTNSPHIYYTPQNKPIESFRLIFDSNTPPPSYDHYTLTYDSLNPQNATLNLGNSYWVDFDDTAGAWVNGFVVDLARNDYSSSKWVEVSFGSFSGFSDGPIQKKSTFSILNSQNQDDRVTVNFNGAVLSDFIINSQSRNSFAFRGSSSDEVNGNINISDSNSTNTFDFAYITYRGTFTNAISTNTQINLDSGSNVRFIGDINTMDGGVTTINILASGTTLQGNILADNGKNLLELSSNITSLTLTSTFTANSSGINQINFSNTSPLTITSENGLILKGDATYESGGGNVLVESNHSSFSLQNSQGEKQAITTQSGITKIDGISFKGNIQTLGGITLFSNFDNNQKYTNIEGNIIANGGNNLILNSNMDQVQQWLAYGNSKNIFYSSDYISITSGKYYENDGFGMTNILGGDNNDGGNIFYIDNDATIFLGYDPSGASIKTIGGLTQIIFAGESGSLGGSVVADGGNNEIIFKQNGEFYLEEVFWARGTSTNTIQIQKNASISTKILKTDNSDGGNIINISDGAKLTITDGSIYVNSSPYSGRFLFSTGGGKNILRFEGESGGFSGNIIASGADNDIIFSQSGTFDISGGDIPNDYYNNAIFLAFSSNNNFLVGNHSVIISTAFSAYSEHGSGNNFIIDSGGSLTFSKSASLYVNYGYFNFIIGDGGSLNLSNKREKTSLITYSGETSIEFDNYGSLSGNIQTQGGVTLYFKNTNKGVSPYAILDASFEATGYGTNIISIDANGTILKSNNGLQFSSSQNGKNRVKLLGDGVSLTLQNVSDNQIQTLNSNGVSEVYFVGANQTFNGNILSLSGISTITLGGVDNSSNAIVGKATINGNITADGGNNAFSFLYDSSTLSMGASSQIIANSTSTNTFTIDKNIIFLTDLTLSGNATGNGGNMFNISSGKTLSLKNGSTPTTLITNSGSSHITLDESGTFEGNINTAGGATHLNFNGDNSALSGNISTSLGNTIIDFSGDSQLSGSLDVSDVGNTEIIVKSDKTGTISKSITADGKTLNINLGDNSTLTLNGNLSTTKGETTISFIGSSGAISGTFITGAGASTAFELGASDSQSVVATITGTFSNANGTGGTNSNYNGGENFFAINAKDTTLINDSNGLIFTSGSNTISFENTSGATLHWRGTSGNTEQNITTTGGNTEIKFNNNGTIAGGIDTSGGNTTLYLGGRKDGSKIEGIINGAITSSGRGANNVEFDNSNNTLTLKDNATFSQVSNLKNGNNNGISFYHTSRSSTDFKTLTIGSKDSTTSGISGNGLNFIVYAISNTPNASLEAQPSGRITQGNTPKVYADKIIIHSSSNEEATTHNLGVVFENQDNINLDAISYTKGADNNILIASVSNSSQVSFNAQSTQVLGFDVAQIDYVIEKSTDENGNISGSGYTSYFVGKARAKEVVVAEQEITATAFTLNYDLYMANLNSLNKRMGELRENAHSQGVWARIFNGALSNEFGLGSKSNYTTIQAGYDYAFGFEGANNYLGVALSYALSTSTSQNAFDENGQRRGIDGIYSNAVEVALYNSYVSDSGWYNDNIAKFSYIMSKFDINNLNDNTSTSNDASNFAFTLSDEVGYVFKLGEAKEWSITPQIEATFGYFSQSDFKQTLANSSAYLDSMAENVLTLRTRVGSAFAYDFKNFTQKDTFNASLYIGAFYEYDYVSGGEIKMSTQRETQTNKYSNLSSDGRVVMNVGTNMSIKDNTRLYFDFEKSFGGKITTDYQVNFGVRYSFGESNGYTPMIEKVGFEAPLKIEGEEKSKEEQEDKEKIENKAQESKEVEKATDKTQENEKIKEEKKEQKETENKEDSTPQE